MRIVFCTHSIDNGGAARSLFILVRELAKRHHITVVSLLPPRPDKQALARYAALNVPVQVFPYPSFDLQLTGCASLPEATLAGRAAADPRDLAPLAATADVVCCNGYPSASLLPFFPSARKVLIAREVPLAEAPGAVKKGAELRGFLHAATAISPQEAASLASWGIPHEIIYNTPARRPRFHSFTSGPPHFATFSEWRPHKGLDTLLNACAQAAEKLRIFQARISLFGADPARAHPLVQQAQDFIDAAGMADLVHIENWTDNVEAHMTAVHCVLRPDATGSPWGRDVIEAFSLGRPVLATGSSTLFVKHGETGLLVPPGNVDALSSALIMAAARPDFLKYAGRNAAALAAQLFDPQTNAARMEAVLAGEVA